MSIMLKVQAILQDGSTAFEFMTEDAAKAEEMRVQWRRRLRKNLQNRFSSASDTFLAFVPRILFNTAPVAIVSFQQLRNFPEHERLLLASAFSPAFSWTYPIGKGRAGFTQWRGAAFSKAPGGIS
jgi:hypothetical protein